MASKLNAGTVLALKPKTSRYERPDGGCSGLYLYRRPSPSGAKTWAVRFRSPLERSALDGQRKNKKLTLGPLATVETDAEPESANPYRWRRRGYWLRGRLIGSRAKSTRHTSVASRCLRKRSRR